MEINATKQGMVFVCEGQKCSTQVDCEKAKDRLLQTWEASLQFLNTLAAETYLAMLGPSVKVCL